MHSQSPFLNFLNSFSRYFIPLGQCNFFFVIIHIFVSRIHIGQRMEKNEINTKFKYNSSVSLFTKFNFNRNEALRAVPHVSSRYEVELCSNVCI